MALGNVFAWLASTPSLLFGQNEPAGVKSSTPTSPGVDIPLGVGTPIGNILPGTVLAARYYPWGGQVDIQTVVNGAPTVEEYLHLDQIFATVGQQVNIGDIIGTSGGQLSGGQHPSSPAFSTGPHIKFSLFQYANPQQIAAGMWGTPINPASILQNAQSLFGIGGNAAGLTIPGFGLLSGAQQMAKVLNFLTSVNFAKVATGILLVLFAFYLFVQRPAAKVATTVVPIIAAAS